MTIPDFMPVLSKGSHENPRDGACVMEYVSILAGEKFSDMPKCTHSVLADVSQMVNDQLQNHNRHKLVPLISRLFGTSSDDYYEYKIVGDFLRNWLRAQGSIEAKVNELHAQWRREGRPASWIDSRGAAWLTLQWNDAVDALLIKYLTGLLDEYDRVTGRTTHREVTKDELRSLTEAVGSNR